MSNYISRVKEHEIFTITKNLLNEISELANLENLSSDDIETISRIKYVLENFKSALETNEKKLISISWLDESAVSIKNIMSYINTFKSNRNSSSFETNSNSQLTKILDITVKINCVRSKQTLRGVTTSVTKYMQFMDSHYDDLSKKVEALSGEIQEHKNQLDNQNKQGQAELDKLKLAIGREQNRLDGFASTYQTQMNNDQKSFVDMLDTLKDKFSDSQDERQKRFDDELQDRSNQNQEFQHELDDHLVAFKMKSSEVIQEYTTKFVKHNKTISDIVGILSTNTFSHKYRQVANNARWRALVWHIITVLLMLAVGAFAVYAFVITTNQDTSWVKLVAKVFATTSLATGAAYAAHQASKQEKVERYARKIEMELVTIDPFIESLDAEKRSLIKEDLAKKLFGNNDAMGISHKDESYHPIDKFASSIDNSLKEILNTVSKDKKL